MAVTATQAPKPQPPKPEPQKNDSVKKAEQSAAEQQAAEHAKPPAGSGHATNDTFDAPSSSAEGAQQVQPGSVTTSSSLGTATVGMSKKAGEDAKLSTSGTLAQGNIQAHQGFSTFEAAGQQEIAPDTVAAGELRGPGGELNLDVGGSIGTDGIEAHMKLSADGRALEAGGSLENTARFQVGQQQMELRTKLGGEGLVGTEGSLSMQLKLGRDGRPVASIQGEGFAGAKGELKGEYELSAIDSDGTRSKLVEGTLAANGVIGVAAKLDAGIGYENGAFSYHAKGQLSFPAGGGVESTGTIHAENLARMAPQMLEGLPDQIAAGGAQAVEALRSGLWTVGESLGHSGYQVQQHASDAYASFVDFWS